MTDPMTQNIGPGDDDYGRKPRPVWKSIIPPENHNFGPDKDTYGAGPCPVCEEFAVGAERSPDGQVFCRHGHRWDRPKTHATDQGLDALLSMHGVDPAKPGSDHTACKAQFTINVEIHQQLNGTARMTAYGPGQPIALLSVTLKTMPDEATIRQLVEGVQSAAISGIKNLSDRINNPDASMILDILNKGR